MPTIVWILEVERNKRMNKWKLIRDELPKENGEYLVSYEDAVTILQFFNGKWYFVFKDAELTPLAAYEETEPNLAWMPLPEPCEKLK